MPKRDDAYMADRRNEILDAAAACIVRDGFAGFSTTSLCKQAGISTGALYRHFPSREAVIVSLTERSTNGRELRLNSANLPSFRDGCVALLRTLETEHGRYLARLDLQLASAAAVDRRIGDLVQSFLINRFFEAALVELKDAGELMPSADPAALAEMLHALFTGAIHLMAVTGRPGVSPELVVDAILGPHAVTESD